jgi:hypothetical protein
MSTPDNPVDVVVEIPLTVTRTDPTPVTNTPSAAGDVGDAIDPTAPDPTPKEITDPTNPDHVEPLPGATPTSEEA